MIQEEEDYDLVLERLQGKKYIKRVTKTIEDFREVKESLAVTPKLQQVNKRISGFEITRAGIIAYRKDIISPFQKMRPYLSNLDKKLTETTHKEFLQELINSSSISTTIINACINNAPLVVEILITYAQLLSNMNISF